MALHLMAVAGAASGYMAWHEYTAIQKAGHKWVPWVILPTLAFCSVTSVFTGRAILLRKPPPQIEEFSHIVLASVISNGTSWFMGRQIGKIIHQVEDVRQIY